jgi:hypothetical protein
MCVDVNPYLKSFGYILYSELNPQNMYNTLLIGWDSRSLHPLKSIIKYLVTISTEYRKLSITGGNFFWGGRSHIIENHD